MKEEAKHLVESIASNPKVSLGVTAMFTSNVWLDYGEPLIKGATSVLGLIVVIMLIVKHALDIKKEHFSKHK